MSVRAVVVEDDMANIYLATFLLEEAGAHVLTARDGSSGLALIRAQNPDVVVLDLHLPKLDGYEVMGAIRADPATASIPVLAATAFTQPGEREKVLQAGFVDFLEKPLDVATFASRVLKWTKSPAKRDEL